MATDESSLAVRFEVQQEMLHKTRWDLQVLRDEHNEALSKITSLENELSSERKSRMLQVHQQQLIEQKVLEEQEGEILALRQQVETLEEDKRVKDSQLDSIQQQVRRLEAQVLSLNQQIHRSAEDTSEREKILVRLHDSNHDLTSQITQYKNNVQEMEQRIAHLVSQQQVLHTCAADLDSQTRALHLAHFQLAGANNRVAQLEQQIQKLNGEVVKTQETWRIRWTNAELNHKHKLDAQQRQYQQALGEMREFRDECQRLRAKLALLSGSRNSAQSPPDRPTSAPNKSMPCDDNNIRPFLLPPNGPTQLAIPVMLPGRNSPSPRPQSPVVLHPPGPFLRIGSRGSMQQRTENLASPLGDDDDDVSVRDQLLRDMMEEARAENQGENNHEFVSQSQ